MQYLVLLFLGFIIGTFGTIMGIGGGFILVPFLIFFYKVSPQTAVGTSLCIVAMNAISGSISYAKQKRINYRTGFLFAIFSIPGSILGAYCIQYISFSLFNKGFGFLLLCVSVYMFLKPQRSLSNKDGVSGKLEYKVPVTVVSSFIVGFLSSMAGIGGGIIHVPMMLYILHFSMFVAVSTSHFVLAISTTVAAISHSIVKHIFWDIVPFLGIGTIIGAQIGAKISLKINTLWIIRSLAAIIFIIAMKMLFQD